MENNKVMTKSEMKWFSIVYDFIKMKNVRRINCLKLRLGWLASLSCNRLMGPLFFGSFCFVTSTLKRMHHPLKKRTLLTCYLWHRNPIPTSNKCSKLVHHQFPHSKSLKKYLGNPNKDSNNRVHNDLLNHEFS